MQENWYDWAVRTKDYLHNATLSPRQFDAEKTDHVHCEICWAKFSKRPEDLHFGYYEEKSNSWICEECFQSFWRIISLATKIMSIIFEMLVKVISKQSIAMAGNSLIRLSTLK